MSRWFGSKILVDGRRRERQQLNPMLAAAAGVQNGAQLYEAAVIDVLKRIRTNRAGAILLQAIDAIQSPWTRVIRIQPPVKELSELGLGPLAPSNLPNPNAKPKFENSASATDDTYKTPGGGKLTGDGSGSSSELEFDPAMGSAYCTLRGLSEDEGSMTTDNILFHELIHSFRQMTGKWRHDPMGDGYDYLEELIAIMITNIYMSLEGVPNEKLRGSHSIPFLALSQAPGFWMTFDMSYYSSYDKQIDRFAKDNPELYRPLANIQDPIAKWNPLRQREMVVSGEFLKNRPSEGIFGLAGMLSK